MAWHRARPQPPVLCSRMKHRRYDDRDEDGARRYRPPSRRMLIAAVIMIVGAVSFVMAIAVVLAYGW
jgi:hypothetical protein